MMAQLNDVKSRETNKVMHAIHCINISRETMLRLKLHVQSTGFSSLQEEISFFKTIKPRFHSQLIFYIKLYNIEINRPTGSNDILEAYLIKEFHKLKIFFEDHTAFYHYYRSGETSLDEQYFTRQQNQAKRNIQFLHIDADHSFSTLYDYQVARIQANEMLSDYLNIELSNLDKKQNPKPIHAYSTLSWSESKVALAELIYAFLASGVFDKSKDIKSITDFISESFNIKMGNIYKIFEEIRLRKKNRTVFLDFLRQNLIQRMDRDDEQAL